MRQVGFVLLFLGIASSVAQSMDIPLRFLSWIDNWGEGTGWGIRGGCCALGGLLIWATKRKPKQ